MALPGSTITHFAPSVCVGSVASRAPGAASHQGERVEGSAPCPCPPCVPRVPAPCPHPRVPIPRVPALCPHLPCPCPVSPSPVSPPRVPIPCPPRVPIPMSPSPCPHPVSPMSPPCHRVPAPCPRPPCPHPVSPPPCRLRLPQALGKVPGGGAPASLECCFPPEGSREAGVSPWQGPPSAPGLGCCPPSWASGRATAGGAGPEPRGAAPGALEGGPAFVQAFDVLFTMNFELIVIFFECLLQQCGC